MNASHTSSRRVFLQSAGAAVVAGACLPEFSAGNDPDDDGIIDCHAHIYSEDEQKYPPIEKPYRPPAGTGTVAHLRRVMNAAGVSRATAIQTSTFYRWDNRFTADASREHRDVLVGICTLNPDDSASPRLLEEYVTTFNVAGMRSIPAASGRFDDPGVDALWAAAEKLGVVINVLANADQKGEIATLIRRHPELRVTLDHCLNIKAGPTLAATLDAMRELAEFPRVHAKLSFLPTGSDEEYPFRDMHEPCRAVIRAYSPQRCVWGSDFPCELWCPRSSYEQHLRIFTHELELDAGAQRAILRQTPRRLYLQKS